VKGKWQEYSESIIREHWGEVAGMSAEEARKVLNRYYPFGQRRCHPYKMWCKAMNTFYPSWASRKSTLSKIEAE